jgi:hypothetical protein
MVATKTAQEVRPVGKSIRMVVECKVEIWVPLSGVSADELAESVRRVRDELGRELMRETIEGIQEVLVEQKRLPAKAAGHGDGRESWGDGCRSRSFRKQGFRHGERRLRTALGELGFRVRNVGCEKCGKKYSPILGFLGLRERQRRLVSLERVVAEVVSLETYGRSEGLVEKITGERIPDATMHDWMANIDWDELKLGRHRHAQTVMADGTGFKKRGGQRGDLRVVIGISGSQKPFGLGVYSGMSWEEIGPLVKDRLKDRHQAKLFMHDGEVGLDEHLAGLAEKTGRCTWHMPRGLKYALWGDGADSSEQKCSASKLHGILAIEVPAEDWQKLKADDLAPLSKQLEDSRKAYGQLVDEFGARGYLKARDYLANAMSHVFTKAEMWLKTGIVLPGTSTAIERIMRELGRRLKKLGYNWTDAGLTRIATILLKKIYEPEAWDEHWGNVQGLLGLCRVSLKEIRTVQLSIVG